MKINSYKYSKIFKYGFWGILTTLYNVGIYNLLIYMDIKYNTANIISIVTTKILAYLVNKIYVFKSKTKKVGDSFKEIFMYIITRGITALVEFLGVMVLVELMEFNEVYSKYIVVIFVVILNYILGNKYVFKNQRS